MGFESTVSFEEEGGEDFEGGEHIAAGEPGKEEREAEYLLRGHPLASCHSGKYSMPPSPWSMRVEEFDADSTFERRHPRSLWPH